MSCKGEAIYHLSSGNFKYIEIEITEESWAFLPFRDFEFDHGFENNLIPLGKGMIYQYA